MSGGRLFVVSSACPAGTEGQIYSCPLSYDLPLLLLTADKRKGFTKGFPSRVVMISAKNPSYFSDQIILKDFTYNLGHHSTVYDFLDRSNRRLRTCGSVENKKSRFTAEVMSAVFCMGAGAFYFTFSLHANCQTLLEATKRTPLPLRKVHGAVLLFCAGVLLAILH